MQHIAVKILWQIICSFYYLLKRVGRTWGAYLEHKETQIIV